jgi:hypothetical protein
MTRTPQMMKFDTLAASALSAVNDLRGFSEICEIRVEENKFLCKTKPISRRRNCSIPFCDKRLSKNYNFVESQKQSQSKPIFISAKRSEDGQTQFSPSIALATEGKPKFTRRPVRRSFNEGGSLGEGWLIPSGQFGQTHSAQYARLPAVASAKAEPSTSIKNRVSRDGKNRICSSR